MPEHFTREEAEAQLPRVEPLLRELRELAASLTDVLEEYTALQAKMRGNGHSHIQRYQALRERIGELRGEIEARLQQITELGVLVKDIASGLIDFPSLLEGREVYLCWRLGEGERIGWWHEVEAGFVGRQPLED